MNLTFSEPPFRRGDVVECIESKRPLSFGACILAGQLYSVRVVAQGVTPENRVVWSVILSGAVLPHGRGWDAKSFRLALPHDPLLTIRLMATPARGFDPLAEARDAIELYGRRWGGTRSA